VPAPLAFRLIGRSGSTVTGHQLGVRSSFRACHHALLYARLRFNDDLRALIADSSDEDLIDRLTERFDDVLHLYGVVCDPLQVPLCVRRRA
jgi:hypothetical protein